MTEEPRALSIIYAPEDCPHRDCNEKCHHRYNLDNICDYPHDFPDECPLTVVGIIDGKVMDSTITNKLLAHSNPEQKKRLMAYLNSKDFEKHIGTIPIQPILKTKIIDLRKEFINKKHLVAYLKTEIDKANKIIEDHGDEELWFDMGYVEGLSDVLWHITKNDSIWAAMEPKP